MASKSLLLLAFSGCLAVCLGQNPRLRLVPGSRFDVNFNLLPQENTTPVPILRYIDSQNPDGSYTYGYESGDGTYKIETRYATGEVKGKYGYLDTNGQLREVEYGATPERGFEPRAEGLILPPPTVAEEQPQLPPPTPAIPAVEQIEEPIQPIASTAQFDNFAPVKNSRRPSGGKRVVVRKKDRRARLPIRGNRDRNVEVPAPRRRPAPRPAPTAAPRFVAPVQPATFTAPTAQTHAGFDGHPAQNIDLNHGTYSIFYSG